VQLFAWQSLARLHHSDGDVPVGHPHDVATPASVLAALGDHHLGADCDADTGSYAARRPRRHVRLPVTGLPVCRKRLDLACSHIHLAALVKPNTQVSVAGAEHLTCSTVEPSGSG